MGIADAEYTLLYIDVGRNGRFSDGGVFNRCTMPVPYVLVAVCLTMVQREFNYRLRRARRIIENIFGVMSARFRVLRAPIHLDAGKTKKVTLACYVLHNNLITTNKRTKDLDLDLAKSALSELYAALRRCILKILSQHLWAPGLIAMLLQPSI